MLLDEATASLDTKSESAVQLALENAAHGRTTITIAHRLSSIRNADNIVVLDKGRVVEEGTHDQLCEVQGIYHALLQTQGLNTNITSPNIENGPEEKYYIDSRPAEVSERDLVKRKSQVDSSSVGGYSQIHTEANDSVLQLSNFIWTLNSDERNHLLLGLLCSLICGSGYPICGIFFGNAVISISDAGGSNGAHSINFWAAMFLMLGIVLFISYSVQGITFAFASSRLISRARMKALQSLLRQDICFFDFEVNAPGSLAAFLSNETYQLAGISGAILGSILNSGITILVAIIISCIYAWKIGLVCISTIPLLLSCGFLRFWVLSRMEQHTKRFTEAAADACEATSALRTVSSLTMEQRILEQYHRKLLHQFEETCVLC